MNDHNRNADRDKVLYAFHQECERPTAEQILDWITRFPQYAEDIRAHAAVSRDWATREVRPVVEASEALLARGHSNALNALYNADMKKAKCSSSAQSLHEIAAAQADHLVDVVGELRPNERLCLDFEAGSWGPLLPCTTTSGASSRRRARPRRQKSRFHGHLKSRIWS